MAPSIERWRIGSTTLTAVVEAETHVPASFLLPDVARDDVLAVAGLPAGSVSDDGSTIGFRVQAFVLEHRGKVILVDPCVGNHKALSLPLWNDLHLPWLDHFRHAGFDPETVEMVVHTHLHEDHIGWDTHLVDGAWIPTFPNATHVYVGDELDYAMREDRRRLEDPFAESVEPVLNAGLGLEVEASTDLGDGLLLFATPGHTPGHTSLLVETGADDLVITGDLIDHQFQCARPALAHGSDWKPGLARQTRSGFLDHHARRGSIVAGTHFPVAPVGRIVTEQGLWRFDTIPTSESTQPRSERR